jgi:acyl-coenzyme A synthetase/AMP-(fatty) acid ligase
MKMPPRLRDGLREGNASARFLWGADGQVVLADLERATSLDVLLAQLSGASVLIATYDQLANALALIELDGIVRRLIMCSPDLPLEHIGSVIADGEVTAIITDRDEIKRANFKVPVITSRGPQLMTREGVELEPRPTEWVLLTSGTTGAPKMVRHTLAGLTGAIKTTSNLGTIWGTFYDIRRYGGLQVFFRSVLGGGSLALSSVGEPIERYLNRLAALAVTHVLGTPSHWRRALMSPAARKISPRYVRLSGEIADQVILDALHAFYPSAQITHAFASTESGVGFEVTDGQEGFPDSVLGVHGDVEIKVANGSLMVRSPRTASCYIGAARPQLTDEDGFVDTGDIVERRGERWYFLGRKTGIINVGGLKVHPEEVEAVINRHRDVRMSLVRSRKNPITGALVVAEVVLKPDDGGRDRDERAAQCKREILEICHAELAPHKIPVSIRFVPSLDVAPAGKIARPHA